MTFTEAERVLDALHAMLLVVPHAVPHYEDVRRQYDLATTIVLREQRASRQHEPRLFTDSVARAECKVTIATKD